MSDEKKFSIPMNGWTVMIVLIICSVLFIMFGTPEQHEMFLGGIERIIAATKDLLT